MKNAFARSIPVAGADLARGAVACVLLCAPAMPAESRSSNTINWLAHGLLMHPPCHWLADGWHGTCGGALVCALQCANGMPSAACPSPNGMKPTHRTRSRYFSNSKKPLKNANWS